MRAILIVEEPEEREFLSYHCRAMGLAVARTAEARLAADSTAVHTADLLLIAKSPPQLPDLVATLRAISPAPLILLTDPLPENVQCALLDAGADLLLTRPYSPRLLTRYIRRQLFRAGTIPLARPVPIDMQTIQLDPDARRVTVLGQKPQDLTRLEYGLLHVLMNHPDQVIPVDLLIERVWGYSGEGNRELIRGLVRRLRRKIEPDPQQPRFIHTHPGIGYRFTSAED